jgi:hypothetical protein
MDRKHSVSALRNIVRTTRSLDLLDKLAPSIDAAAARQQALVRRLLIKDLLLKLSQDDSFFDAEGQSHISIARGRASDE